MAAYVHLGGTIAADGAMLPEIKSRSKKHRKVTGMLRATVSKEAALKQEGRALFTQALAGGVLWYNAGTWLNITQRDEKQLDAEILREVGVITGIKAFQDGVATPRERFARARPFPTAEAMLRSKRLLYLARFWQHAPPTLLLFGPIVKVGQIHKEPVEKGFGVAKEMARGSSPWRSWYCCVVGGQKQSKVAASDRPVSTEASCREQRLPKMEESSSRNGGATTQGYSADCV